MAVPKMKCEIRWIDGQGNPTPDTNDASGIAIQPIMPITYAGQTYLQKQSAIPCCAEHAKRIRDLSNWRFLSFE